MAMLQIKKYAPCIRVDVPLMIKLLEYSREESSSDTDLHLIAENMGYTERVIQVSHESVWLIYRGNEWHTIK